MSQLSRQILKANEILRELDAVYPGGDGVHPQFQLRWSEDLWSLIPRYEMAGDEPKPVLEYRCQCGVDVTVHSALCSRVTVAKTVLDKVKTFGLEGEFQSYSKVWVLCTWSPPPSKADWIDSMGTDEDYPANGRYIPVHRGAMCVVIPRSAVPADYPRVAGVMVKMMKEHAEKWRGQLNEQFEKARRLQFPLEDAKGNVIREPDKDTAYWRVKERVADKMRTFGDATVGYSKSLEKGEENA